MSLPALPSYPGVAFEERPCSLCCGEGSLVLTDSPGRWDEWLEAWVPDEEIVPCEDCMGTGIAYSARLVSASHLLPRPVPDDEDELPF